MLTKRHLKIYALAAVFLLAACAPADLDITPTVGAEARQAAADNAAAAETVADISVETQALFEHLLANLPESIGSGQIQWAITENEPFIVERDGGLTARLAFDERGGSMAEITIGVFNDDASATAYYENRVADRRLEQGETREIVPEPNRFGQGTYGSMAVWTIESDHEVVMQVVLPVISSTFGDELTPLVERVDGIMREAVASFSA